MNRTREGQGSKRMEDSNNNQRNGKLLRICKLLLKVHPELQSYSKAIQWPKRKEGIEMGRRLPKGFQRCKRQDYKLTSTLSSKKERKV